MSARPAGARVRCAAPGQDGYCLLDGRPRHGPMSDPMGGDRTSDRHAACRQACRTDERPTPAGRLRLAGPDERPAPPACRHTACRTPTSDPRQPACRHTACRTRRATRASRLVAIRLAGPRRATRPPAWLAARLADPAPPACRPACPTSDSHQRLARTRLAGPGELAPAACRPACPSRGLSPGLPDRRLARRPEPLRRLGRRRTPRLDDPPPARPCSGRSDVTVDPLRRCWCGNDKGHPKVAFVERMSGGVLLSHAVTRAVPSALRGLASGFGMEPGVSLSLWPPKLY